LRETIKEKHCILLTPGVMFLHGNALVNNSMSGSYSGMSVSDNHPLYSPDLATDFRRNVCMDINFQVTNIQADVLSWLEDQDTNFYLARL